MAPLQRRPRPVSPTLLAQRAAYQAQLGGGSLSSSAPVLPALADRAAPPGGGALALAADDGSSRGSRGPAGSARAGGALAVAPRPAGSARAGGALAVLPRPLSSLLPADHPAEATCQHGIGALLKRCRDFEVSGKDTDCQTSCAPRRMRGLDVLYFQSIDPMEANGPGRTRRRSSITGVDDKQRRIRSALKSVKLFSDLDHKNPGLIAQLAQEASIQRFAEDFVLFRQGDPPKNCYVVMRGKVGVFIHRPGMRYEDTRPDKAHGDGDESGSDLSSPRSPQLEQETRRRRRRAPTPRSAKISMNDRFKTGEGFSSFNKHSVIGKRENTLGPGTLFGETALDNDTHDAARNATIKCDEDLEALAIPKKFYKKAMAQVNVQKDFICANLPGAQFGYRLTHPATFFVMREFEQGHTFLHEGVMASERAVFCVYSGQVEVRRYRRATDSPAYVLAHRPLEEASWKSRCPPPPLGEDGTLAIARPSDGASRPALRDSVGRETVTTFTSSFDMPELMGEGGPDDDASFGSSPSNASTTGARCPADQVAIEVIESGGCFCPLSFYPLPGAEPLTMVAVSETCKLLCATEQDVKVFPAKFIKAMRSSLMQDMTRRLRAIRKMDLETAQDVARPDREPDWISQQQSRSVAGSLRSQVSRQGSQVNSPVSLSRSGLGGPSPSHSFRGSPSPGRSAPPSPAGGSTAGARGARAARLR